MGEKNRVKKFNCFSAADLVRFVYNKHRETILKRIEEKRYAKIADSKGNEIIYYRGEGARYSNKIYGDWNMTVAFIVEIIEQKKG